MSNISDVIFWMGGVITPSIPAILSKWMGEVGIKPLDLTLSPGFSQVWERFMLGQIDADSFCRQASEAAQLDVTPEALRDHVLAELQPVESVLAEVAALPDNIRRWLVVDIPRSWQQEAPGLAALDTFFPAQQCIFLTESGLVRLVPELFYHLSRCIQRPLEHCLLIEPSYRRSVTGVQHGIHTAHFIHSHRLRREFYLRGFHGKVNIHQKQEQSK